MPGVPIPVSQFDDAVLPLTGLELIPMVQGGETVKAVLAAISASSIIGSEFTAVVVAGANPNVPVTGNRALVNTTPGAMQITGFAAQSTGTILLVTNVGINTLELMNQNVGSLLANRLYGVTDIMLPAGGSQMFCYSGTLARWVFI